MNRICLFALFISVITACNKTDLPENEDFKQNPQLTEAEAIVVARHFSGNTRNEPEAIINTNNSYIAIMAGMEVRTVIITTPHSIPTKGL